MRGLAVFLLCLVSINCSSSEGVEFASADGAVDSAVRFPHLGPSGLGQDAGVDVLQVVASDASFADVEARSSSHLEDAVAGYGSSGVLVFLGVNPCDLGGWDPSTGKCYAPPNVPWNEPAVTSGVCGPTPSCGTHASGTVLMWDSTLPRYRYLADPSGGTVCLPNDVDYVVGC